MRVRQWLPWSSIKSGLGANLPVALIYYGLAEVSRHLASTPNAVTPVWPPDGFAVYAILFFGNSMLPGVFLGSFLANIQAFWNLQNTISFCISVLAVLGIAGGTTLGTWLGTFLLHRNTRQSYPFDRVSSVIKFLGYAGLLGPIINATVGVAMLVLDRKVPLSAYQSIWSIWWISNVAGIFILTPLLLTWSYWLRSHKLNRNLWRTLFQHQGTEALVLSGFIFVIGQACFWNNYPLAYGLIPLLVWAAFRFGQLGATLSVFIVSAIAVLGTVRGLGTFAGEDLNQSLMGLQSFIAVIVFTSLVLIAVLAEQAHAKARLKEAFLELQTTNQRLEQQTQELANNNQQLEQTLQELKTAQSQIVQSEKMSALGNLVAGVAHEINNPLGFLHGSLHNTKRYTQDLLTHLKLYQQSYPTPTPSIQENAEDIDFEFIYRDFPVLLNSMESATDRIKDISTSLRTFSRKDTESKVSADLHKGLDSTLMILKYRLKSNQYRPEIDIIKNYGDLPLVDCLLGQLNQVFMNLLANAIDMFDEVAEQSSYTDLKANPQIITLQTIALLDHNRVEVRIRDNGTGMPESVRARIFDHLFNVSSG